MLYAESLCRLRTMEIIDEVDAPLNSSDTQGAPPEDFPPLEQTGRYSAKRSAFRIFSAKKQDRPKRRSCFLLSIHSSTPDSLMRMRSSANKLFAQANQARV